MSPPRNRFSFRCYHTTLLGQGKYALLTGQGTDGTIRFVKTHAIQQRSHVETLIIYKLGSNQNYYTFPLTLLIRIVLCSKFPMNHKCFHMRSASTKLALNHRRLHHFSCPQGYLTYKKSTTLGPYRRPIPRVLGGS
jgi:hypothetical protein